MTAVQVGSKATTASIELCATVSCKTIQDLLLHFYSNKMFSAHFRAKTWTASSNWSNRSYKVSTGSGDEGGKTAIRNIFYYLYIICIQTALKEKG